MAEPEGCRPLPVALPEGDADRAALPERVCRGLLLGLAEELSDADREAEGLAERRALPEAAAVEAAVTLPVREAS